MSKQYVHHSWSQLALGVAMLLIVFVPAFISLANTIGLGVALGKVFIGLFIAGWILVGVVFIVRGLNRM